MIINIGSLVESLAETIDLVSSEVNNHHRRVACIAASLGEEMGLSANRFESLVIAAALHDIGGLTTKDRLDLLDFEENSERHSEYGYLLLRGFRPFAHIAPIVRYHHAFWQRRSESADEIPAESRVLFLADRISVLIREDFNFGRIESIRKRIAGRDGTLFMPDAVRAFMAVSVRESFWLDARGAVSRPLFESALARNLHLNEVELLSLGRLYSQIIDFRSAFTAAHSSGVAAVAQVLARLCGFSVSECVMMKMAGYLHDIGKLVIPEEIIDKPGRLTDVEYDRIRSHTYYTDRLLAGIREFEAIRTWAAMHHERLDGKGYPFHVRGENLSLGSRIMAVADVFTAVTEDRPYRGGMDREGALNVLTGMVDSGALDGGIVQVLVQNYEAIDGRRREETEAARRAYGAFYSS